MNKTRIQYVTYSSNPIRAVFPPNRRGFACVRVSEGCARCYAEQFNLAHGTGLPFDVPSEGKVKLQLDEAELKDIRKMKAGATCFVCDMTDIAWSAVPDEWRTAIWDAAFESKGIILVLTKRIEALANWASEYAYAVRPWSAPYTYGSDAIPMAELEGQTDGQALGITYPGDRVVLLRRPRRALVSNLWIGATAENQARYDERRPHLERCPAALRYWSLEPLLGPINLHFDQKPLPQWVIVGGESGRGARVCNPADVLDIVLQCRAHGVRVFVKQLGSNPLGMRLMSGKGDDPAEWPELLRVREFPT